MRVVLCLIIAACWHPSAPSIRAIPPVFEGVALERSTCTKGALLMPVEIDGVRGQFIVDSGAFINVVYESFARRANLSLEDNHDRVGGGHGVPVMKVLPRSFAVPGLGDIATPPLVMLPHAGSPLAREGCNIAGVISPATLTSASSALLVDFGAARLARIADTEVDAHLARVTGTQFVATTGTSEYTPGIDVAFGERRLRMMIDTGACCTWVTTTSAVGRASLPRSREGGTIARLLGTTRSRVARAELVFGAVRRSLDIRLLTPDAGDATATGAIGADALETCVVAIRRSEMRGVCR
jgi:hypothetical protein